MATMFQAATNFNQNLSNWNISGVTQMQGMFSNTNISTSNYSNILVSWNALPTKQIGIELGAFGLTYSIATAGAARSSLGTNYSWTFFGDSGV
jgi:surface protein